MSGARPLVLCLGHRFRELHVERAVLEEVAGVIDWNTLPPGELNAILTRVAGVLLGTQVRLDREAVRRMRACRVVVRYGIGVDNVDLVEAAQQGILVGHMPGFCVEEVATHSLARLLCAHRRIRSLDDGVRRVGGREWSCGGFGDCRALPWGSRPRGGPPRGLDRRGRPGRLRAGAAAAGAPSPLGA